MVHPAGASPEYPRYGGSAPVTNKELLNAAISSVKYDDPVGAGQNLEVLIGNLSAEKPQSTDIQNALQALTNARDALASGKPEEQIMQDLNRAGQYIS